MPEAPTEVIGQGLCAVSPELTMTIASILPEIEQLWPESVGDPEICVAVLDYPWTCSIRVSLARNLSVWKH